MKEIFNIISIIKICIYLVNQEDSARGKANFSYVELSMLKDDSEFSILGIDQDYQGIVFGEVRNQNMTLVRTCTLSLLGKSRSINLKNYNTTLNSKISIKIESRNFMHKETEDKIQSKNNLENSDKFQNKYGISCFEIEYKNLSQKSKFSKQNLKTQIKNFLLYLVSSLSLLTLWAFTQLMFIKVLDKYGYRIMYIWIVPNIIFLLAEIFIYENFLVFINTLLLYMNKDLLFYNKGTILVKSPLGRRSMMKLLNYFNYRSGALMYFFYSLIEYNKYYSENLI